MAINRVPFPTTPNPVAGDWGLINTLLGKAFQNINSPLQVDGSNIPQGATFNIGGIIYHAASDTAITGSTSDYVKLTPNSGDSGATCDAAFIANLTGVAWNKVYNGYYSSGNLIIFDEIKAIIAGTLSGSNSKFSELWNNNFNQQLKTTDDVEFNSIKTANVKLKTKVLEIGDWNMDSLNFRNVNHGLTMTKIRSISGILRDDGGNDFYSIGSHYSLLSQPLAAAITSVQATWIVVTRLTGGAFDSTSFDRTSYNRGWLTVTYED